MAAQAPVDPSSVRHALLVSTDRLGDLIWTTPAIRLVREVCPAARITFVASKGAAAILEGNPRIDRLVLVDQDVGRLRTIVQHARLGLALRKEDPPIDLGIEFNHGRGNPWLFRAARVSRVAGTRKGLLVGAKREGTEHIAQHRLDLVESLFGIAAKSKRQELFPSDADRAKAAAILREHGVAGDYVVLHSGTSNAYRRKDRWLAKKRISHRTWFEDRYSAVAAGLIDRGLTPLFTGIPAEAESIRKVIEEIDPARRAKAIDLCGRTRPLELAALLERARLYVGADTGPTHVAAATGTPLVCLYGPSRPQRTGPFAPAGPHRILYEKVECSPCHTAIRRKCTDNICMKAIGVDLVLRSCDELLAAPAAVR